MIMKVLIEQVLQDYKVAEKEAAVITFLWKRFKKYIEGKEAVVDSFTHLDFLKQYQSAIPTDELGNVAELFVAIIKRIKKYPEKPLYVHKVYKRWLWYAKKKDAWRDWEDIVWVFSTTPTISLGQLHRIRFDGRVKNAGAVSGPHSAINGGFTAEKPVDETRILTTIQIQ
jgi:hypothetical protein